MNRLLITIVTLTAALAAWAQNYNDSTLLTTQQWKHAVAIVAQYNAINDGYGQNAQMFPAEYTLDDLNPTYQGKKTWDNIYNQMKTQENKGGTVADVKALAGNLAGLVEKDLKAYIETSVTAAQQDTAVIDTTTAQVVEQPVAPVQQEEQQRMPFNMTSLIATVVGLIALIVAILSRMSLSRFRKETEANIETTNRNMQQLADDLNAKIEALRQQVQQRSYSAQPSRQQFGNGQRQATTAPPQQPVNREPQTLYLSKPDENGIFMRANKQFELGNSIFVLNTDDGTHGSFSVIDNRDVHQFALMMPTENLTYACTGNGIQMSSGMTRIITDRDGEAVFENGHWHVTIKAIIHYE